MLVRPDVKLLQALMSLRALSSWETVLAYLTEERAKTLEVIAESHDEVALRKFQGRAQVLKEVLELANNPGQSLTKLEAPKRLSDPLF